MSHTEPFCKNASVFQCEKSVAKSCRRFVCVCFQFLPSFLQWEQKQLIGKFVNVTLHPNMKVNVSFQPAGYVNIYVDVWAVNVS